MSYFEFGKSTLQIPQKMIFVNKQGYEKLAPTTTKSGSLTSRFGIRSLNVEPVEDNDINLIKGGVKEYVEIREQKKRQKKTKEEREVKYKDVKKKNKGVDKEVLKYNKMLNDAKIGDQNIKRKYDYNIKQMDKKKQIRMVNAIQNQIYDYYEDKADNKNLKNRTSPEDLIKEHDEYIKKHSLQNDVPRLYSEKEHLKTIRSIRKRYPGMKEEEKPVKKQEEKPVKKEEADNYSKITALLIKAKELAKRMEGSEDKERFELMGRITKLFNDANKLDGGNKLKDRMKEVNTIKNIIKDLPPTPSEQLGI